jgi:hypothetical protein
MAVADAARISLAVGGGAVVLAAVGVPDEPEHPLTATSSTKKIPVSTRRKIIEGWYDERRRPLVAQWSAPFD